MSKEDYEDLEPHLIMETEGKIGNYAPRDKHWKEINWIAKELDIPVRRIGVLENTVDGDEWVMVDGHWIGDLAEWYDRIEGRFKRSERFYEQLKKSLEEAIEISKDRKDE